MVSCSSCGRETQDYNKFPCPNPECKAVIVRCKSCRVNENAFTCKKCGFSGP